MGTPPPFKGPLVVVMVTQSWSCFSLTDNKRVGGEGGNGKNVVNNLGL